MSALPAGCPSGLAPAEQDGVVQDPAAFVTEHQGRRALELMVRGASCAGCLSKIESAVAALPGVAVARLNLTTGRLRVEWTGGMQPMRIVEAVTALGYGAAAYDARRLDTARLKEERRLLVALTVAGLATAMVMFFSEPVWFGTDMPSETRALLRWMSAIIVIPAVAFSGQPFFRSAAAALQRRRVNMDVPVSLAVILAIGLSLIETWIGGEHAYFDASVMLLFFLLIGRFLDARLRRQAYAAANALASLQTASAMRIKTNGKAEAVRAADLRPGDRLLIAAGERLPANAEVVEGVSDVDLRMVTGEVEPVATHVGQVLHSGTVNLSAALQVRVLAEADQSLMADVARMLEAGEQKKSSYRRIADRVAQAYVPYVFAVAVLGFAGWMLAGASLSKAAFVAVTVLIITCPCAMALAAPLVQVVAAGRLFRRGVYLTSGDALERIASVDHVVFDKTGTLTLGDPLLRPGRHTAAQLEAAAQLARASRHPFSRAIARAVGPGPVAADVVEHPGRGVSGLVDGQMAKLGAAAYAGAGEGRSSQLWFAFGGEPPVAFEFEDVLRPDTAETIASLKRLGLSVELLSGDGDERVARAARAAGIDLWTAQATPQSKAAYLQMLEQSGRKVLMVGDGLNDAGALAGAHASLAPGGAVDVSRLAADCVFSGEGLGAVVTTIEISRTARRRMQENFGLAALYNVLAVPIALAGWATPLVAAIAMSASSAVVTLNALRLARDSSPGGTS